MRVRTRGPSEIETLVDSMKKTLLSKVAAFYDKELDTVSESILECEAVIRQAAECEVKAEQAFKLMVRPRVHGGMLRLVRGNGMMLMIITIIMSCVCLHRGRLMQCEAPCWRSGDRCVAWPTRTAMPLLLM